MGQFSVKIFGLPGSHLSANQQQMVMERLPVGFFTVVKGMRKKHVFPALSLRLP